MNRKAQVSRETKETKIKVSLDLEGSGKHKISSPIPFLNHMLSLMAAHGLFDLTISARGDTDVDDHHTVEDIGICLGQAFKEAWGQKVGIRRYGSAFIPMDESLATVHIDLSGRPCLIYQVNLRRRKIGNFEVELVKEFLQALVNNAAITVHVQGVYGHNGHHMVEAIFKALGRALRQAVAREERIKGIPSTKGRL